MAAVEPLSSWVLATSWVRMVYQNGFGGSDTGLRGHDLRALRRDSEKKLRLLR
jgi:hypothetical protein